MAAVGASELVGADDEFDRLRAEGEVLDRTRLPPTMDSVAGTVAVRAKAQRRAGDHGKADGVRRRILADMGNAEAVEAEQFGPKVQLIALTHRSASNRGGRERLTFILVVRQPSIDR